MKHISNESLLDSLNWRYAVKKFDPAKKISESDWNTLAESLRLTPSSYGLQPWKFLVVQNPELRKRLTPVSWGQSQIVDSSHFVVLTTLKQLDEAYVLRYIADVARTRGVPLETLNGYRDMMIENVVKGKGPGLQNWTQRQAYIAMGNLLNSAALLGIDATPMEGLDPAKYDEILDLGDTPYATVAAVALGYRHTDDPLQHAKKVRFTQEEVIEVV